MQNHQPKNIVTGSFESVFSNPYTNLPRLLLTLIDASRTKSERKCVQ